MFLILKYDLVEITEDRCYIENKKIGYRKKYAWRLSKPNILIVYVLM